jgi:regulator of replication initiation timing
MEDADFQSKLTTIMGDISTLPQPERDQLQQLAEQARARHEQLKQTVTQLQENMDFLRHGIKYLVFDLEATRRENETLRRQLGNSDQA